MQLRNYIGLSFYLMIALILSRPIHAQESLTQNQIEEFKTQLERHLEKGENNEAVYYINKIAYHYWVNGMLDEAISNFEKALELNRSIKNKNGVASIHSQIATIYMDMENYQESLEHFEKALGLRRAMGNNRSLVDALLNYSEALGELGKFEEAINHLEEARRISLEIDNKQLIRSAYGRLAEMYGKVGETEKQYEYFEIFKGLDRDIQQEAMEKQKEESQRIIGEIKEQSDAVVEEQKSILKTTEEELNKQRKISNERLLEIKLLNVQNENQELRIKEQEAKLKLQKVITLSLAIGFILVVMLSYSLYRGYIQKRKANEQLFKLNKAITQQKEEIRMQNYKLELKNEELIELNKEKNYIIGIVAHDLRSPMHQMRGLINILKLSAKKLSKEHNDIIDVLISSIDRVNSMISRILDINAMESKSLNLDMRNINLAEIFDTATEELKYLAEKKNIEIVRKYNSQNYEVALDQQYMLQIAENLISNAIKFSPFNSKVMLDITKKDNKVRATVIDEGPGIPNEERGKLFGKFQRLSNKPTNGETSTGLGLSIVKKYVEAMDGKVWCESEEGNGSSFIVEFKVKKA
mgnify:CR=1 FL=1